MADDTRKVRVEEQLKIKIGEAKQLVGRNGQTEPNGGRDVYCTIALDQEEICRTPTIERSLNPFFGEEYQFQIPRKFRYLSVYVYDRDRHLKQDKPIGKIAIRREELHGYNHKDHWFPLRRVDADSEVQGMIHIIASIDDGVGSYKQDFGTDKMKYDGKENSHLNLIKQSEDSRYEHVIELNRNRVNKSRIRIKVDECVELTKKNGTCDPYAMITAQYSNCKKITKRTKSQKKTVNPTFSEEFDFDMQVDFDGKTDSVNAYKVAPFDGADLCEIVVSLWHDAPGMGEDVFLGERKIQLRGKTQQNALQPSAWYFLQPRTCSSRPARSCATPPGTRLSSSDSSLGSLRLKLLYAADHVFPLATYDCLMNLLLQSVDQKPITSSAVYILGELIANKTEVAQPLVRLFTHKNLISSIIKVLADHEISKLTDPTTIFRGNTLVSKMMDEAMRLSGLHYLHTTLRPIVELILHEKKPCEIDPARCPKDNVIETNLNNLQEYVEKVFEAITKSAIKCPNVLCEIFHNLRECAAKHFPHNREVRYSVVSGFIFLRFFAPAILGPKLFDLTTEPLDPKTNRTLTLISKTIQSLGNLVSSRSAQQPCKEEFMGELYKKFCTEKHVEAVKHFLEVISTVSCSSSEESFLEPVLLKEGMMTKRAQGRRRFGRRNFKQRYFRLTTQSLSYAKSKGKRPICDIPLSEIEEVVRLNERNFKMQNIFQIKRKDRPLLIQTANCVEEKEWVDLLSKICQTNASRLEHLHPCAFINGMWTCCKADDLDAKGCTTAAPESFQIELATALDPARDLQRLHSLIIANIQIIQEYCGSANINNSIVCDGDDRYYRNDGKLPLLDDLRHASSQNTLQSLIEIALVLDKIHRKYKNMQASAMYGSRHAPIGDDNYLIVGPHGVRLQQQQQHQQQTIKV